MSRTPRTIWTGWPAGGVTPWPVVALYLHTDKAVERLPWGSVTLLDHQTTVEDVRIFSALPESQRERHIRLIVKRYQRRVTYCSMLEAIQYLKREGVKVNGCKR